MMIREKDAYRPGDQAVYCEDGARLTVSILENNSDSSWIRYTLRVIQTEAQPSAHDIRLSPGHVFSCEEYRKSPFTIFEFERLLAPDRN